MDPLRPSNIDFQRRGVDEATKFFYITIDHATKRNLKEKLGIRYEDPEVQNKDDRIHNDATKILIKLLLDFRWQMKQFEFNSYVYSVYIFYGCISADELKEKTRHLREMAVSLAHQKHLSDNFKERASSDKCGTSKQIVEFFEKLVWLVNKVTQCLKIPVSIYIISSCC